MLTCLVEHHLLFNWGYKKKKKKNRMGGKQKNNHHIHSRQASTSLHPREVGGGCTEGGTCWTSRWWQRARKRTARGGKKMNLLTKWREESKLNLLQWLLKREDMNITEMRRIAKPSRIIVKATALKLGLHVCEHLIQQFCFEVSFLPCRDQAVWKYMYII